MYNSAEETWKQKWEQEFKGEASHTLLGKCTEFSIRHLRKLKMNFIKYQKVV